MTTIVEPWFNALTELQRAAQTSAREDLANRIGADLTNSLRQRFYSTYPCLADGVSDQLPQAETLLLLAQRNLGADITPDNVERVRAEVERIASAKSVVARQLVLKRIARRFPSSALDDPSVAAAIMSEYEPALQSIKGAEIPTAGRVHELILLESLGSVGLLAGTDFDKPSNPSQNGDIRVRARTTGDYLATEVKSLKTRERLARGLREVGGRKVGAGFFDDATEFTANATRDLVGMSASAVYMPSATLDQLPRHIVDSKNAGQRRFYRPITQYARDMKQFVETGQLP